MDKRLILRQADFERDFPMTHNFPIQPTPFIGREDELAAILEQLGDPTCRLLSLIGPGGIGKTRLAIEAGRSKAGDYRNGAFYVNLLPVREVDMLWTAIADGIGFSLSGQDEPDEQLLDYLSERELLLVLDDLEHLIDGVDLIAKLLGATPHLKLLVSSRESLNLQGEWLFPVGGLPYPSGGFKGNIDAFDAVHLFASHAKKIRPDFSLEDEASDALRICQLVEGMPLALEIAASWIKTLRCASIASEIENSIEFLTSSMRDVPQRHRSMQAVFDQTWEMLDQREKIVFQQLSVFRGGFDHLAAGQIAGAGLPVLSGLVDKSILRLEPDGRYHIHELTRQYAEGKLQRAPEETEGTQERYGLYYLGYLHDRQDDLMGGRQSQATLEIKGELENVRAAWKWAVDLERVDEIERGVMAFSLFCQYQGRYLEGRDALRQAVALLRPRSASRRDDLALASTLCDLGFILIRLGQLDEAERVALESLELIEKHDAPPLLAQRLDPLIPLSIITSTRGDYDQAARLGEQALRRSETQKQKWNRQFAHYLLARAALPRGEYETAAAHAQQSCDISERNGDRWFMAYCLNELGNVASALDDHAAAKGYFQASYELRKEFGDPEGMAVALNRLGEIKLRQGEYAQAGGYFQQGEAIYREINDKGGLAASLHGLAQVSAAQGDLHAAQKGYHRALQIASRIQYYSLATAILIGIARLYIQAGDADGGIEILSTVENHVASEFETRELARRMRIDVQEKHPAGLSGGEKLHEGEENLGELISRLIVQFPMMELEAEVGAPPVEQPLIDPLTGRELEVLQLIARGLTNQEIAETLVISTGTAKWYTSQIYSKLGVRKRTQAVALARELGLLD
jgi:predicted ATPase/DNA-binding CsgD family transcriptional regulator